MKEISENEKFVRNVYPDIVIQRWCGNMLGVYDDSVSTKTRFNRGKFLGQFYSNNPERTWSEIRGKISNELMETLEWDYSIGDKPPSKFDAILPIVKESLRRVIR